MSADLDLALAAARAAADILRQRFRTQLTVRRKGEVDLVTEADLAAETAILDGIRAARPADGILAEESGYSGPATARQWVIDPLDGTTNFAHGFPWFAVSIALVVAGRPQVGVICQPMTGEEFTAERGQGARRNGTPLRVSAVVDLAEAFLATGFPYDRRRSAVDNLDHFAALQKRSLACRRAGSACLDLAYTAAGCFDGYWEMKLKPWDIAAGALLVEEAGGRVTDFAGGPLDLSGEEIVATNGPLHRALTTLLCQGQRPGGER